MRWGWQVLVGLAVCCSTSVAAIAEKRVALIIGNSAYQKVAKLTTAVNDAGGIAKLFKAAGFDLVDVRQDLGGGDLRRAIREFSRHTWDADTAVVFYAGHGMAANGLNYLVPVDAKLETDLDVEDEAVSLDQILKMVEPAKRLRLVILDACRDNPFLSTMKRTTPGRPVGRGLAQVEPAGSNTLVAIAAKAGSVAADGDGTNSPFTAALLKHVAEPGLDLRIAFDRVRDEVLEATGRKQEPSVYGSFGGATMSLAPAPATPIKVELPPAAPPKTSSNDERRDYELAERVGTIEAWDWYLTQYSRGFYADLARAQRAKLIASTPAKTEPMTVEPPKPTGRANTAVQPTSSEPEPSRKERSKSYDTSERHPSRRERKEAAREAAKPKVSRETAKPREPREAAKPQATQKVLCTDQGGCRPVAGNCREQKNDRGDTVGIVCP
jgi:hypothetical protein